MTRSTLGAALFLILFGNALNAAERYDGKAYGVVNNLCGSCHGIPFHLTKIKDDDEWKEYFQNEKNLIDSHKGKPEALKSIQSKKFVYFKKRIVKFFIENSKYSGKVHGCDADFCGVHN